MAEAALDHLVVAASELDAGAAWLEERLGVTLAPGGRHAAMGTHNRLLKLGPRLYLELIAVDPAAPAPTRLRWFGLDDPALREKIAGRPRLIHWVARCNDISAASAASAGQLVDILDLARGDFRWRITVPADGHLPGDGLAPSLIEWRSPAHPADRLPERGCTLMKLEGFHPEPARIRSALADIGLTDTLAIFPTEAEEMPCLLACIKTPAGLREID
ncbi:MAG: VOC family protein [Rhodocyclales bacterium]|nr:VOC family protein [Rhodocyclales bacterium]